MHGFRGSRSPDGVRGTLRDDVLQRRAAGRRDWNTYGSGRTTRRCGMDGSALRSILFDTKPNDPGTLAFAGVVLLSTAILAGYAPARMTSRMDPLEALR